MPSIVSVPAPTAEIPHKEHFQVDDGNWVFLRLGYNFDSCPLGFVGVSRVEFRDEPSLLIRG